MHSRWKEEVMKAAMKLGNHSGLFGWMAAGMAVAGALGGLAYATAARRNGRAPANRIRYQ